MTTDVPWLWVWWTGMVAVSVFNIGWMLHRWSKIEPKDSYGKWMKYLAVPWVLECAWRSVFPSLYLQRFVFWDTMLNSIIVDRCWACVGELAWTFQVAYALRHVDKEVTGGKCWIQMSGWAAFVIYIAAECTSYYNTATTNEFFCAVEVLLDGLAFLVMAPAALYLWCKIPGSTCGKSAKTYCAIMVPLCIIYPLYNILVDAPMYLKRYHADQAAHKQYFGFLEGLEDAAVTRHVTHQLGHWSADMLWMTLYFSAGVWSGIALMKPPRLSKEEEREYDTYAALEGGPEGHSKLVL